MADVSADLKLDRSLIDPHFDGYKLSLEPLPTYSVPLSKGVDDVKLTGSQYSYQHVKAFGIHNHLVHDPWHPGTVYYIDTAWGVSSVSGQLENGFDNPVKVFDIPDCANQQLSPGRHHATLVFASPDHAILADGAGKIHIVSTGNRTQQQRWQVCFSETVLGEDKPFTLLHAAAQSDNEAHQVDCLLLHVDPAPDTSQKGGATVRTPNFVTVLEWLTYVSAVDRVGWSLQRTRRLTGMRSPDYAALDQQAVLVAADRPFTLIYDSEKPVEQVEPAAAVAVEVRALVAYTWQQDDETLTVQLNVPPQVEKADVDFQLTSEHVKLGVKNGDALLDGDLHAAVDVSGSTWTIEKGMLELSLVKRDPTTWPLVVVGDTRGEMVLDKDEVKLIHDRLACLTSQTPGADPEEESQKPAYNAQELEECDMFPDETAVMLRIDGESHCVTHQVHLGSHQWLFNVCVAAGLPPVVCLRHDVDGVVWRPPSPWTHTATFNALGYVQASKQNRKFTGCAPDFSYSFIADCSRHVYIYRQTVPTLSPLRNRKTGREVGAVAKQQVISLDGADDIYGVVATPEHLYIISGKTLYMIKVKVT